MFEASQSMTNESSLTLEDLDGSSCPSYAIVQEQMRDLITIQETAIGNLAKANVETLNASRDIFHATLQSKEERIDSLQKSIAEEHIPREKYEGLMERLKNEFVPRRDFEALQLQLQEEHERRNETQEALQNTREELRESHDTIKTLEEDGETNQVAFHAVRDDLKQQLSEVQAQNNLLQSRLNEQLMLCEQQQDEISRLRQHSEDLQRRQHSQTQRHRQQLRESEVEKQQEAYLHRMMADREARHKKRLK